MLGFFLSRIAVLLATLLCASLFIFLLVEVIPGDAASIMLGVNARPDTIAALRIELDLDGSAIERYFGWISGMLRADFGISYSYRVPVAELISQRVAVSLPLALMAMGVMGAMAFIAGVTSAVFAGTWRDRGLMTLSQFLLSMPIFWLSILLILCLAIAVPIFPAGGFPGWDNDFWGSIVSLILPAIALALPQAAILARVIRSSLVEVSTREYIRTARGKGLTFRRALLRHGFRNASLPIVAILGLQFSFLLSGVILVETVFSLPGIGSLLLQALGQRDLIVIESTTMILVAEVIVVSMMMELLATIIDPRLIRVKHE